MGFRMVNELRGVVLVIVVIVVVDGQGFNNWECFCSVLGGPCLSHSSNISLPAGVGSCMSVEFKCGDLEIGAVTQEYDCNTVTGLVLWKDKLCDEDFDFDCGDDDSSYDKFSCNFVSYTP
mmetsp:Transcript_34845/g.98306  ORF Transcript_34845/g.98306 Transcript_34845/m.98306 type:complete len:120 (+) Transcript_34845:49-408(+)